MTARGMGSEGEARTRARIFRRVVGGGEGKRGDKLKVVLDCGGGTVPSLGNPVNPASAPARKPGRSLLAEIPSLHIPVASQPMRRCPSDSHAPTAKIYNTTVAPLLAKWISQASPPRMSPACQLARASSDEDEDDEDDYNLRRHRLLTSHPFLAPHLAAPQMSKSSRHGSQGQAPTRRNKTQRYDFTFRAYSRSR